MVELVPLYVLNLSKNTSNCLSTDEKADLNIRRQSFIQNAKLVLNAYCVAVYINYSTPFMIHDLYLFLLFNLLDGVIFTVFHVYLNMLLKLHCFT